MNLVKFSGYTSLIYLLIFPLFDFSNINELFSSAKTLDFVFIPLSYSLLLIFIGNGMSKNPIFDIKKINLLFESYNVTNLYIIYILAATYLIFFQIRYEYNLTYGTQTLEKNLSIPYSLNTIYFILTPFRIGAFPILLYNFIRKKKIIPIIIISIIFLLNDIYSRRYLMIFLLIFSITLYITGVIQKRRIKWIVISGILILPTLFNLSLAYDKWRRLSQEYTEVNQNFNIEDLVSYMNQDITLEIADDERNRNLERVNVLPTFDYYAKLTESRGFMEGNNLKGQFINVIPRFIYPEKVGMASNEGVVFEYYSIKEGTDLADSIPLHAFIDFGYVGIVIYGLLFCFIILIFEKKLEKKIQNKDHQLGLIIYIYLIIYFIFPELSLTTILSLLRDLIIFSLIFSFFKKYIINKS